MYTHMYMYSIYSSNCIISLAMQMWTLARFLPFAIGHMIPEGNENWENYLHLLEIMDIVFARRILEEECGYLESLISDHHASLGLFIHLLQSP